MTSSPAAYDTIRAHFADTGRSPAFYDLILTGDLGSLGKKIVADLFRRDGIDLSDRYEDCGCLLYDPETQDVHAGASGCGCSALVLTGYLLPGMKSGRWKNILFCGTGALHSPTATMQGESIPGICHAVAISCRREGEACASLPFISPRFSAAAFCASSGSSSSTRQSSPLPGFWFSTLWRG